MIYYCTTKIDVKEHNLLDNIVLTRPTKYSVKKLEVKSVKQKNLFEPAVLWRASYFSVAMNNNFRNILSALIFLSVRSIYAKADWFFCFKTKEQCNNVSTPFYLRRYISIKSKIPNLWFGNKKIISTSLIPITSRGN